MFFGIDKNRNTIFCLVIVLLLYFSGTKKASAAGPVVWVEDGMTRVFKNDTAKVNQTITLFSAKNEYESFQIIVKAPSGNNLTNVKVTVSNLTGPNSAVIQASNLILYREHYLYVTQGSKHYNGETNKPLGPGWYPDALIPFKHPDTHSDLSGTLDAVPFSLAPGENQPIWVDIYTPVNTSPGVYQGTATVTSTQGSATVNIILNVWNFTLPKKNSLKGNSTIGVYNNRISIIELLKHRANPKTVPLADERFLIDNYGLQMIDVFRASGATRFTCNASPAPPVAEVQAEVAKHQPDLFLYNSYANEVFACAGTASTFLAWAKNLRLGGIHPAIVTHPLDVFMGPDLNNTAADIWSLLPKNYDIAKTNVEKLVNNPTTEIWAYNPLVQDGYSPKFTVDFLPINYRIMQGFINQSLGFTGTKFWRIDNWGTDPWNNTELSRVDAPGEGHLVNRGDDVGLPSRIVPGFRLKLYREGSEDFDYVELLKQQGQGQFALDTIRTAGTDFRNWTKDKNVLLAARKVLGDKLSGSSVNPTLTPTSVQSTGFSKPLQINASVFNSFYNNLGPFYVRGMMLTSINNTVYTQLENIKNSGLSISDFRLGIGSISFLNSLDITRLKNIGVSTLAYNPEGGHTPTDEFSKRFDNSDTNPIVQFAQWGESNGFKTLWAPLRNDADSTSNSVVTRIYSSGLDGISLQEQQFIEKSCPDVRTAKVKETFARHRQLSGKPIETSIQIMANRCLAADSLSCGLIIDYPYKHCRLFIDAIESEIDSLSIWPSTDDIGLITILRSGSQLPTPTLTPTPTGTPTPTPTPTGSVGSTKLKFKLVLPDIIPATISIPAADVQVEIQDGTSVIGVANAGLIRSGNYFQTVTEAAFNISRSKTYNVSVKTKISLRRIFNNVTLTGSQTLDCTVASNPACGELISQKDTKLLLSGDSDGFIASSGSYNKIDSADLQALASFFNQPATGQAARTDFNLDSNVNVSDLEILGRNYGGVGD